MSFPIQNPRLFWATSVFLTAMRLSKEFPISDRLLMNLIYRLRNRWEFQKISKHLEDESSNNVRDAAAKETAHKSRRSQAANIAAWNQ